MATASSHQQVPVTMKQAMIELHNVNWSSLGEQLGIPEFEKTNIERTCPTEQVRLMKVLGWWIDNDYNVTWTRLAVALDKMHLYSHKEHILWKYCPLSFSATDTDMTSTDGRLDEEDQDGAPHVVVDKDVMEQLHDLKYSFGHLTGKLRVLIDEHLTKNVFKRRSRRLKAISILSTFLDVNSQKYWSFDQLYSELVQKNDLFKVKTFQRFFRSYFERHSSRRMASMNYIASHQLKIDNFEQSVKFIQLKECVQVVQPRLPDFGCLTLILSEDWEDFLLSALKKMLKKIFNIHETVLLRFIVRQGSIIVEFEFPEYLRPILADYVLKNTGVLQTSNVIELSICGIPYFQKSDVVIPQDSLGFAPDTFKSTFEPKPVSYSPPVRQLPQPRPRLPRSTKPSMHQHQPQPSPPSRPPPLAPLPPHLLPIPSPPRRVLKPRPLPTPHPLPTSVSSQPPPPLSTSSLPAHPLPPKPVQQPFPLCENSPSPDSFADEPSPTMYKRDIPLETQHESELSNNIDSGKDERPPSSPRLLYGKEYQEFRYSNTSESTAARYSSSGYSSATRYSGTGLSNIEYPSTEEYSTTDADSRMNTRELFSRDRHEKDRKHGATSYGVPNNEDVYVPYVALKEFKEILFSERTMFQGQMDLQNKLILELKEEIKFLREDSLQKQEQIFAILNKTKEEPHYSHIIPNIERPFETEPEGAYPLPLSSMDHRKACPICFDEANPVKMITLPGCYHTICTQCFVAHFEERITSQNIKCFVCPVCGKPDIPHSDFPKRIHDYFISLSHLIMKYMDDDTYNLFQKKLTEFYLSNAPQTHLIWCPTCYEPFVKTRLDCAKTQCPSCEQNLCPHCKKEMTKKAKVCPNEQCRVYAHEESQKRENKSIDRFIDQTMIECPSCSGKFSLDSSGCDHLQCVQCSHEFCRCCGKPYFHGNKCTEAKSCKMKGLHAHHPRNCVYYLRDIPIYRLEGLLSVNNRFFGWDDQEMEDDLSGRCFWGKRDIQCERLRSEDNHGPLCLFHYKDYLISRIRNERLDPADIFDIDELKKVLQREELSPISNASESNEKFIQELVEYVKISVPLDSSSVITHRPRDSQQEKGCNVM